MSKFFPIRQGVCHGCSLSTYLFIICIELLSHKFSTTEDIKGIFIQIMEFKKSSFADDASFILDGSFKVSKGAKIRNRYNQVPHLTQDTNGKVTNSQLDTTNESQEVSPFQTGDHKAHIIRRAQRLANTSQNKNIKYPQKKYRLGTASKYFTGGL